ncbi:hypothetical protein NEUTE1DRAFT_42033 [Neurospora tetrasperma FGSC 2508]|uniref:Velvet domain-containing protein n=1 Tax=Neurospora tetrasperma (strain FGSC 2508 / ATCC MYA-4615 / P0657) TaxID=510951 RepID=F8MLM2_NEUT8|nr:uncharacterized protein NEUTE1DRAFT_42033 [Neurospora tetrasperma FGSC 2508]EGO58441.1 hypothetical protein NEUTE1DRAFT_42033 [Neurospora tetrasperma FGSC 2508]EGZ71225.1 hypothetical protein NEUTE2DRAFT_66395 [Neurospora tetrasperma FGSC 2509]
MSTSTSGGASFVVQPPEFILTKQNIKILAVVRYGPLPSTLLPEDLHAFFCLGDPTTNKPLADISVRPVQTGQGLAVTGVALPGEEDGHGAPYAFFLFHNAKFLKEGTYKMGVSINEDKIDVTNLAQLWSREFTVGEVAGDMRRSPDEQRIIDKLKDAGVFGAN